MIDQFTKRFTEKKIETTEKDGTLYLRNDEILEKIAKIPDQPITLSLPLGKEKGDFKPTLYLLELLSKESENKVFLNDKAEWLWLCGRDAFMESVTKDLSKEKIFLVQNERDENLGLGIKQKSGNKTIIKNLTDRGDFLRRER